MFEPFKQYCEMSGLSLMIVPKGFDLTPPQINSNDEDNEADEDIRRVSDAAATSMDDGDEFDVLDSWG